MRLHLTVDRLEWAEVVLFDVVDDLGLLVETYMKGWILATTSILSLHPQLEIKHYLQTKRFKICFIYHTSSILWR